MGSIAFKKKVKYLFLIISVFALVFVCYIQEKWSAVITLSHDSGFYEDAFMLTITGSEHYTLRYTLDGSEPDENSQIYDGPILIEDASGHENIYSDRTDISPGYTSDAHINYGNAVPEYLVDKCNIVRAALFDAEETRVDEVSGIYFVGFDEKNGYDGMYIISVVTDPDNLFDEETGIYVIGEESSEKANYEERGIDWEREVSLDIFEPGGSLLESCQAGIRIHGGASRSFAKKSFNLYARICYSGRDTFATDFFDNGQAPHKMILSSGGNDETINIKNYMVQKLAVEAESQFATMKMIPSILFLDGEYWGVYYLTEAYDSNYLSIHYGVDEEQVILFKNDALEEGEEEDYTTRYLAERYIVTSDMSIDDNYEAVCEMIDMESFIDYYALEIYVANQDWLPNNTAYWRTRDVDLRNPYSDGKWRWMLFDTDLWGVLCEFEDDTIAHAIENDEIFASLVQNKQVQQDICKRLIELQDIYAENCDEWIEQWLSEMSESVYQSNKRFWGEGTRDNYFESTIESMREYADKRGEYLEKYMDQHFME